METILKKYAIFIAIIVLIFGAGIYFVAPKISEFFSVQSEFSSKKSQIKNLEQDVESAKLAKQRAESKKDEPKIEKLIYESEYKSYDSKVNFNVQGRKLTVFGKSEVKDKEFEQDIQFSQDFILPENADTAKISKEKDGNKLIISVPIKN